MKLILLSLIFVLAGCASNSSRSSMILRTLYYVPKATQVYIESLPQEDIISLANSGFEKFDLQDLYRFNQLRLQIVRSSLENCHALMQTSGAREEEMFNSLDDQQYDEFARLKAKAFVLGSNQNLKGTPRPSKASFEKALGIVYSAPDSISMKYIRKDKAQEDCWALEKILSYTDEKRNTAAETLVRYMTTL